MKRRHFTTLLGGTVLFPLATHAQQPGRPWRVGQVLGGPPAFVGRLSAELERQLSNLGYANGKNIVLSTRFVAPTPDAMDEAVLALLPDIDLLVAWGTIGGVAAKKFASAIPVVFLSVGAPVEIGVVESLSRPGGNITGVSFEGATETYAKRLQLLKEIVPNLGRVAVLRAQGDANVPFAMASLNASAPTLGVTLTTVDFKAADELNTAFEQVRRSQAQALLVVAGALTYPNGKRIAELALGQQLPSCYGFKETVVDGGLVSLGPDLLAMAGQGASYVDKILRGAKPADLPVQQPTRYEVYVNLKTAKALGLTIPPSILARADEVIECTGVRSQCCQESRPSLCHGPRLLRKTCLLSRCSFHRPQSKETTRLSRYARACRNLASPKGSTMHWRCALPTLSTIGCQGSPWSWPH